MGIKLLICEKQGLYSRKSNPKNHFRIQKTLRKISLRDNYETKT